MSFWVEVFSGEWNWDKLIEKKRGLNAPNEQRYVDYFKDVRKGDIVVHYLTADLTKTSDLKSSFLGVSIISSNPSIKDQKIVAGCSHTVKFRRPVPVKELRKSGGWSDAFEKLLKKGMQRYLTEITESDFERILNVYQENAELF